MSHVYVWQCFASAWISSLWYISAVISNIAAISSIGPAGPLGGPAVRIKLSFLCDNHKYASYIHNQAPMTQSKAPPGETSYRVIYFSQTLFDIVSALQPLLLTQTRDFLWKTHPVLDYISATDQAANIKDPAPWRIIRLSPHSCEYALELFINCSFMPTIV